MSVADPLPYASPLTKMVRFFHSRDQGKGKCQTAKRENDGLKIRLAAMEVSVIARESELDNGKWGRWKSKSWLKRV